MLGLKIAGVEGTILDPLLPGTFGAPRPGVEIVRPSLLAFRFGGLGGTMKEGVVGAESGCDDSTAEAVEMANFGSCGPCLTDADMFRERFFMFRTFLPGDSGRLRPGRFKSELGGGSITPCSGEWSLDLRDLKDESGVIETADSGDELGEGSVMDEESSVEIVVVGEESVDSELMVEVLSRCCCCGGRRSVLGDLLFAMIAVVLDSSVAAAPSTFLSFISEFSPNTDINDGNEASSACRLICIGILEDRVFDSFRFVDAESRRSECTIVGCPISRGCSSSVSSSKYRDDVEDAMAVYDLLRDNWLAFCIYVEVVSVSLREALRSLRWIEEAVDT